MDFAVVTQLIPLIANQIGVAPTQLLFYLAVFTTGCNVVSRLIPDDATGWLGQVQRVTKVLGVHVSNRVTEGVKTSDVIKEVVGATVRQEASERIQDLAGQAEALIPEVTDAADAAEKIIRDPFGEASRRIQEHYNRER